MKKIGIYTYAAFILFLSLLASLELTFLLGMLFGYQRGDETSFLFKVFTITLGIIIFQLAIAISSAFLKAEKFLWENKLKTYKFYKLDFPRICVYLYASTFHVHFIVERGNFFSFLFDDAKMYHKANRYFFNVNIKRAFSHTGRITELNQKALLTHENPQLRKFVKSLR